jgi:voltage-gated potassium channel
VASARSRAAQECSDVFDIISWTVWAAFAIDFAIRIWLADQRGSYILRHWYDVLLVAIPLLRPSDF